jgi:hypothetical protein
MKTVVKISMFIALAICGCQEDGTDSAAPNATEVTTGDFQPALPGSITTNSTAAPNKLSPAFISEIIARNPTPEDSVRILEITKKDGSTGYSAFGPDHSIDFKSDRMTLTTLKRVKPTQVDSEIDESMESQVVSIVFKGATTGVTGEGFDRVESYTNTLDALSYRTDIPAYQSLLFANVYPAIDLYYIDSGSEFSFIFVVNPGGDPNAIQVTMEGGTSSSVADNGSIVIATASGDIQVSQPYSFQTTASGDIEVASEFATHEGTGFGLTEASGSFAIALGEFDSTEPVIIDPTVTYSQILGNSTNTRLAIDPESKTIYVGGSTAPTDPDTATFYLARHEPESGELTTQTLLFGNRGDFLRDIHFINDRLYIVGETSADLLSTVASNPPALQPDLSGSTDVFAMILNKDSLEPTYGTYFGGSKREIAAGIRADGDGNIYIGGHSESTDLPLAANNSGFFDAFALKFQPDQGGSSDYRYVEILGGTKSENITDVDLDASGNFYLVGRTSSDNLPLTAELPVTYNSALLGFNPFVAKYGVTGERVFSSYVHNDDIENGIFSFGMDVSSDGTSIAFGGSIYDQSLATSGYLLRLDSDPTTNQYQLTYSEKISGSPSTVFDVALDSGKNLYAVGEVGEDFVGTESSTGIAGTSAFLIVHETEPDGGHRTPLAMAFGGEGTDRATNISIDSDSHAVTIVGSTTSNPFVGITESNNTVGEERGFLIQFDAIIAPPPPPPPPNTAPVASLLPVEDFEFTDTLIKVTPKTLNLVSQRQWVQAHISLATGLTHAITVDGSGSLDPDGDLLSYSLSITSDTFEDHQAGPQVTWDLGPGAYIVTLEVCDPSEACDSTQITFAITELDIAAMATETFTLNEVPSTQASYESNELIVEFPHDQFIQTVAPGDAVDVILEGPVSGSDTIQVIDNREDDDDGDDGDDDDEGEELSLWEKIKQKLAELLKKLWDWLTND